MLLVCFRRSPLTTMFGFIDVYRSRQDIGWFNIHPIHWLQKKFLLSHHTRQQRLRKRHLLRNPQLFINPPPLLESLTRFV